MKGQLTREQVAANRAKLLNTALGKKAFLSDRDLEVINNAEQYRIHVFDNRLTHGRFTTELQTIAEVYRFFHQLLPEVQRKCLIYAVWGTRDALIPPNRYDEFILMPSPQRKGNTR